MNNEHQAVIKYYTKLRDELPEHVENREALVASYNQYIGYLKEQERLERSYEED